MWTRQWIVAVAFLAAFALLSPVGTGADKKTDKDSAKSAAKDKGAKAKPRGRLPAYYRQVVDDEQRDKIYAIQTKYRADSEGISAEIEKLTRDLRKKLADLKEKQTKEIESVLTAAQKTKVDQLRADAAAARKKSQTAKKES